MSCGRDEQPAGMCCYVCASCRTTVPLNLLVDLSWLLLRLDLDEISRVTRLRLVRIVTALLKWRRLLGVSRIVDGRLRMAMTISLRRSSISSTSLDRRVPILVRGKSATATSTISPQLVYNRVI